MLLKTIILFLGAMVLIAPARAAAPRPARRS
jgi:hypothetical protein